MMQKEETKLNAFSEALENVSISSIKMDQAIQNGYQKARMQRRKKRLKWLFSSLVAAILLLGFTTLLYTSPTFASYLSKIPGMENFVDSIHGDKGITTAVENAYLEKIGLTQEKNGIKLTIDSVIKDENGMVIFYSVVSNQNRDEISLTDIELNEKYGPYSYSTTSLLNVKKGKKQFEKVEIYFENSLRAKEITISMYVKSKDFSEPYTFDFSLKKANAEKKTYKVNKTVQIDGQKIIIKSISIQPIRTDIHLATDPNNEKKILEFNDLRLVDEHGETWSRIQNGIYASGWENNEGHYYLQSNYFKEPEELYLLMNKVQAIDQNQAQIVIDTNKQTIIKAPDESIKNLKVIGNDLEFTIIPHKDFHHDMFGTVKDATGKEIQTVSSFTSSTDNKVYSTGLSLKENQSFTNPLILELNYYPAWIKGNVKIRIK